jgi:hypothetical protein
MRNRRLLLALGLLTLLGACRERTTLDLQTDPSVLPPELASGDRILIEGYQLIDGSEVRWDGHVSFLPPDRLYFDPPDPGPRPKPATFSASPERAPEPAPVPFTLPLNAVAKLAAVEIDHVTPIVVGVPVFMLGITAIAVAVWSSGGGGSMYGP